MKTALLLAITIIAQVLFFVLLHIISIEFYKIFGKRYAGTVHWGITVQYSFLLLVILIIISNISDIFLRKKLQYIVLGICCLLFISSLWGSFRSLPYKSALFAGLGVLTIILQIPLSTILKHILKIKK